MKVKRERKVTITIRPCAICGDPFESTRKNSVNCPSCRYEVQLKQMRDRNKRVYTKKNNSQKDRKKSKDAPKTKMYKCSRCGKRSKGRLLCPKCFGWSGTIDWEEMTTL